MQASQLIEKIKRGDFDNAFSKLYGESAVARARERYVRVGETFLSLYGDCDSALFSVPGRTELSGNHTDHNNGVVLAASVDLDIIAFAAKRGDGLIKMKSEGYREDVVELSSATAENVRRGSSGAIIAGVADWFRQNGFAVGGFSACTASDVLSGSGLSSSAAFEVMCGRILSHFYNSSALSMMQLALAGKYAENVFFGKPCGLMDQAACASGGCLYIDFGDPQSPAAEKIDFDLEKSGLCLCIVNTGGNHADLTADYADVPGEMRAVAAALGKTTLRECAEPEFRAQIVKLRRLCGDRAVLRAMHFFAENGRVAKQRDALKRGDAAEYLRLVQSSGDSSFKFLQNVYTTHNVKEQGISLALAISEAFGAVCRVHGGGFAGTIQAYVPIDSAEEYKKEIEAVFGENSCRVCRIRAYGASEVTENGAV